MAASNLLTNVTLCESVDSGNWNDVSYAGQARNSDQWDELPIQGLETRSVRVDNANSGMTYSLPNTVNLTGAHVGVWVNLFQVAQINPRWGFEVLIGNANNYNSYRINTDTYPRNGGWQRIWVDTSRTPDDNIGGGAVTIANINRLGAIVDVFNVGGNARNFHIDRIDYGNRGISLTSVSNSFQTAIDLSNADALGVIDDNFITAPIVINGQFDDSNFAFKRGFLPLANDVWARIQFDSGTVNIDSGILDGIHLEFNTTDITNLNTLAVFDAPAPITLTNTVSWNGTFGNGTLTQNGANIDNLSVENSTLFVDDLTRFKNSNLTNSTLDATNAIVNDSLVLDGVRFSNSTLEVNSPNDIQVTLINGSDLTNAVNVGAGNITIVANYTLTINVINQLSNAIENCSISITELNNPTNQYYHLENTSNSGQGLFTYDNNLVGQTVQLVLLSLDYKPFNVNLVLTSVNTTQTIVLFEE